MVEGALYEQFVAVAEQRSFTAAAATLNLAQPWLSARIRRLEEQLGYPLFRRTTRKVELTEQGERLLPLARTIVDALHRFRETAREIGSDTPAVRLGAQPFAGRLDVTRRLLSDFRAQATRFRLDLEVGWTSGLLDKLARGELDASFVLGPWGRRDLDRIELQLTNLEIEMAADDPLAAAEPVAADFRGRRIEVFTRSPNPALFDHFFAEIAACGGCLVETNSFWSEDEQIGPDPSVLIGSSTILWEHPPRIGRVRRTVRDVAPIAFSLVRRRCRLPSLDALWSIAQAVAVDQDGAITTALLGDRHQIV